MQTFGITLQISLSAIVPKQFLEEARKEAQAPEASLFLKTIQAKFPEDDDQFMLAIVKNALRTNTRLGVIDFLQRSGVGGRVSPVQIVQETIAVPAAAVGEYIAAQDAPKQERDVKAEQVRIDEAVAADLRADPPARGYTTAQADFLAANPTPGALVQDLQDERAE